MTYLLLTILSWSKFYYYFYFTDEVIEAHKDQEALSTTDLKQHQRCQDPKVGRSLGQHNK